MKTQSQIAEQVRRVVTEQRPMDREFAVLLPCLDFAHVRPFIQPDATEKQWTTDELTLTEESITEDAQRCLAGAWSTLDRHDPEQANRLIGNFRAYTWLLGTDEQVDAFEALDPNPFGAPVFLWVADQFGWEMPDTETAQRMATGAPCSDLCIRGCRS